MREWRCFGSVIAGGLLSVMCAGAAAQAASASADPAASCIEVEVDGVRAPSYACLTQKMSPNKDAAARQAAAQGLASEAIVQRPSNQLGLFNRAAMANRMGNTFGTSVYPQRPPSTAPTSPVIPKLTP